MTTQQAWNDIIFRIKRLWAVRFRWFYVKIHMTYIVDDLIIIKNRLTRFAL